MLESIKPTLVPIEKMLDKMQVGTVFGEPIKEGEITLIPVAEVMAGFGYGYGSGSGLKEEEYWDTETLDEEAAKTEEGTEKAEEVEEEPCCSTQAGFGSGGGGFGRAKPRGVIRISPEGVRYEPFVDPNLMGLAVFGMIGWSVFWLSLAVRALARHRR